MPRNPEWIAQHPQMPSAWYGASGEEIRNDVPR